MLYKKIIPLRFVVSYLLVFNIIWALAAWVYDWPKIIETPWYVLPFMLICPIYPTLLAVWYFLMQRGHQIPPLLTTFTFIGTSSYGLLSLVFYPTLMMTYGFDGWTLGSIFWVMAYGLQSLILRPYLKPLSALQVGIIAAYFLIKDVLDYKYMTFSYLTPPDFPVQYLMMLFAGAVFIHIFLTIYSLRVKTIELE